MSGIYSERPSRSLWFSIHFQRILSISIWTSIIAVFVIGFVNLAGWLISIPQLKSIFPDWPAMKLITAICFIFAATALLVHRIKIRGILSKISPVIFAILIGVVSSVTIYVYLYSIITGIESSLASISYLGFFLSPVMRMTFLTAVNFFLLACILFLLQAKKIRFTNIAHVLIIPVAMINYFIIVSFIIGAYSSQNLAAIPVVLTTSLAFCFLSVAVIMSVPDSWLLRVFTSGETGGTIARNIILPLMILPVVIGWLRIHGERAGLFDSDEGVVLVAITYTVCFILLVWRTAGSVNKIDRKRSSLEKALRTSEERYRTIAELLPVQISITRISDSTILFTNGAFDIAVGFSKNEHIGRKINEFFVFPEDYNNLTSLLREQDVLSNIEIKVKKTDGSPFWILGSIQKISYGGKPAYLNSFIDITESKKTREELVRLNRMLNALNKSSHSMKHSENELQYLNEACRIIIEDCGYNMVWIGFVQDDNEKSVKPIVYHGFDKSYIEHLNITWDDTERGRGPTGTAIRTGKFSVCQDIQTDPAFEPWREEALKRGYASSLVLPLFADTKVFGAISIYSIDPYGFPDNEINLLSDLANDLAHGIEFIRLAESERMALEAIKEREVSLQKAQEIAHLGSWELDIANNILTWSDEVFRIFGLQPQEFRATYQAFLEAIHPDDREYVDKAYSSSIQDGKDSYEIEHRIVRKPTGEIRYVHEKCAHFRDESRMIIKSVGMVHDITDRKESELALHKSEEQFRHLFEGMTEGFAFHEIILDDEGKPCDYKFLSINPAFERQTGLKAENLIGKKFSDVLPGSENFWVEVYGKVALTGESFEFENYATELNSYFRVSAFSPKKGYFAVIFDNITTRVLAEKELQRTKDHLEKLINNANAPIIVWNPKTEIQVFNKAFEYLTGYSSDEVTGKRLELLFPEKNMEDSKDKIITALQENLETIEIPILCKNYEVRTVLWNSANIYDSDNTLISTIAQGNDITERKKAEELLTRSRQEWIETFDLIPDLIAIIDNKYRIIKANKAMINKLGITLNELNGHHSYEYGHDDNIAHPSSPHTKILKNGQQYTQELFEKKLGGDFLISVTPILDKNGNIQGSVHVAHDISVRKKAENEILQYKEKLDLALDNGSIGIWEWDLFTNAIVWDERMENIFGIEPGSFKGNYDAFEGFMVEEDLAHTRSAIQNALDFDVPFDTVYRIKSGSGHIKHITAKGLVNKNDEGKPYRMVGVCFDITEMKKSTEKSLFNLNEELLRSNKDLEQFAYIASHDLQEPLRMISSFTQLLSKRYKNKLDPEAQEFIDFAVDGALRMQVLINDLLEYSRVETRGKEFSATDIHEVVGQAINNLSIKIKERKALVFNNGLLTINADRGQMIQLFQNLIDNAIKFCLTSPLINISAEEKNDHYLFSIQDNGIGIESQYYDKIFQVFKRLHSRDEYGGTGIGLAICRRIVERHGGKIWVESKPGEGTRFNFTVRKS